MSTVFKTKIDRIKITRFGSKRGLMYIVKKKLTEIPDYSIWDVHDKLSRDSIVLTKEEAKAIALQLLEVIEEEA